MALPTYDELLAKRGVTTLIMKQPFGNDDLLKFSSELDRWEKLARFIGMPNPEIENLKSQGDMDEQKMNMLVRWKQRQGSMATYEAMATALLRSGRTDLAETVISFRCPISVTQNQADQDAQAESQTEPSIIQATPPSPGSSRGIQEMSPQAPAVLSNPSVHTAQQEVVISNLRELQEEFFELVINTESTLKENEVCLDVILRRFRMLPDSLRRRHQTDENNRTIRKNILESKSVKELFDNLAELKHWSYMIPDTLAHIVQDIKIDDMQQKINKYRMKLATFKTKTELKDMIGLCFSVPDYCIELKMEVVGWENKTIDEAEKATLNILRKAAYTDGIGLKAVNPGSLRITFTLLEPITNLKIEDQFIEACKDSGIIRIQIDEQEVYYSKDHPTCVAVRDDDGDVRSQESSKKSADGKFMLANTLWKKAHSVGGGRDVLIMSCDLHVPHKYTEVVPRWSFKLTAEYKSALQNQGVSSNCQDELDIVKARFELDKRYEIVEVKSGKILQGEVMDCIRHILTTTKNDGVTLHYIGSGRWGTGDWCFEDGFITFRDIAQLYLRASHNFKGRVLTIVSDCSYSGCWVRDCMEFLDEQGVQPCGHKAREKGIFIKVFASCKSNQIPTAYHFSVKGLTNDKNTGEQAYCVHRKLSETQQLDYVDTSTLHCRNSAISEPCTLQPGYTWRKLRSGLRLFLVRNSDNHKWRYVILDDDEDKRKEFLAQVDRGTVDNLADYGTVLKSGWGTNPPREITKEIEKEYFFSGNR